MTVLQIVIVIPFLFTFQHIYNYFNNTRRNTQAFSSLSFSTLAPRDVGLEATQQDLTGSANAFTCCRCDGLRKDGPDRED